MICTGKQHRDSIRDGRQVWINGERVKDVTAHPIFRPSFEVPARIYDITNNVRTISRGLSGVMPLSLRPTLRVRFCSEVSQHGS
jgi:aromatic ring hydroxylase